MEEAQRAAEEKAEQLRIQAEKALKQQEEEEFNRKYREDIFQPWGSVSFNTQFTPQGDPSLDLTCDDLFHSPHFLATSKASTTITDVSVVNRITPSVSAQLDDLDAFLNTSRRYMDDADNAPIVGELAWATSPTNMKGHHLYQDIDPRTPYGAFTVEICNTGGINYRVNYRSATYFATTLMPSSSLPQPSLDSEYVPTKYIFRPYVEDILKKFQTRFPNVLMCILRPDPLNDPDIRRFYKQIMLPKKSSVSGTSKEDRHKARVYLQTRVGDYNQANNFLAEVLRTTISRQRGVFYTL
jgi:hypothetical protein